MAGLIPYTWKYRHTETGKCFLFLISCALIWVFFFILETASQTLAAKLLFAKIQFLGIAFLPAAWVFLVYAYTGSFKPTRRFLLYLLVPTLTNIMIWTNPLHHWFYGTPSIQQTGTPFPVLVSDYQIWFYAVHAPTGYIYMLIAISLLVHSLKQMEAIYRAQSRLLLLAILLPTITDVFYVVGISPVKHYNYTTAVFSISGMILSWTLFRFHFLDLLPLARQVVMENLDDGVIVFDHKTRIVEINPVALDICQFTQNVVGQPAAVIAPTIGQNVEPLFQLGRVQKDVDIFTPVHRSYDLRISPVTNARGMLLGWVATFRDITERVELLNKLQILAVQDDLTGIFNRRAFLDLANREISRVQRSEGRSLSVCMIDLDHFKGINDTYGHACGDQVLTSVAHAIQDQMRVYDIFGRLGGEEFGLLLVDVTDQETLRIVERLRVAIEAVCVPYGQDRVHVTASIGIASSTTLKKTALSIETLLDLADQALYRAKQEGRNCVKLSEIVL
jgi:diguanylate cyclase (GGDEF)-like protein